jgi:hypothetical protein
MGWIVQEAPFRVSARAISLFAGSVVVPTASQKPPGVQETALSALSAALGCAGAGCACQVPPARRRASGHASIVPGGVNQPATSQVPPATQETPLSLVVSDPARLAGTDCGRQEVPFHVAAVLRPEAEPTASQDAREVHETASR